MNTEDWDTIGKIEDAGKLVTGGRIDNYWGSRIQINRNDARLITGSESNWSDDIWLYDPKEALDFFHLRSIEFGNWMSQNDRAVFLYGAMYAMFHLAGILNVRPEKTGFHGKLSISLGARGKGGQAIAHYEPSPFSVINLTRTHGNEGCVAHEYAHAIDNILSYYTGSKAQLFVTGGRTTRTRYDEEIVKTGNYFEQQFEELFKRLYWEKTNEKKTSFLQNLQNTINSNDSLGDYYLRRTEIWARTFEVYIYEKAKKAKITNTFLTGEKYTSGIYPPAELVQKITPLIDKIVKKAFQVMAARKQGELSGIISGYIGFRRTLKENASVDDTLKNMKRIAYRDSWQVKELAHDIHGYNTKDTCQNIWNFVRTIPYKEDTEGIEELRTPASTITNNRGDCDDYTILISAILLNLHIPHIYKCTAYEEAGKFQHVYPVAHDPQGNEYVIDCVPEIPAFNYEAKPIIDLKKVNVMELQELSGLGAAIDPSVEYAGDLQAEMAENFPLTGIDDDFEDEILENNFLTGFGEVATEDKAVIVLSGKADVAKLLERGLLAEVNKARQSLQQEQKQPSALSRLIDVPKELSLLNAIFNAWENEDERQETLNNAIKTGSSYAGFYKSILHSIEQIENENLQGIDDSNPVYLGKVDMMDYLLEDTDLEGLGKRKGRLRNFFKKIGQGIKKGLKAVVKFNPATIALRAATLLVLKTNFGHFAEKLIYGYLTQEQAAAQGLDMAEWQKLVDAKDKAEKYFTKIGGKEENIKSAIIKGKAAKKTGVQIGGLGEPVMATTASAIAAATPFIVIVKKLLSKINPVTLFKNIKNKIMQHKAEKQSKESNTGDKSNITDEGGSDDNGEDNSANVPAKQKTNETKDGNDDGGDDDGNGDKGKDDKPKGFLVKVKDWAKKNKKPLIIAGIVIVILIIIGFVYKYYSKKSKSKKGQFKGIRRRRRALPDRLKGVNTTGGSATIGSAGKRKNIHRKKSSGNSSRLRRMHQIAQELKKQHPNAKYSTLLKKAAQQL